jgi:rhodanese-related sulfurtransferase
MTQTLRETDAATVKAWLDRGEAVLIDVREAGEHARESIAGAKLVPLSSFDPAKLPAAGGKRLIVHCLSGSRSARALAQLATAGIEAVNLTGGIEAWKAAGLPVRENKSAPLPIMRQVQIVAGTLIVAGAALGAYVHPGFHALSAFVGAGLVFAGASGWCGMANLLALLPYNRRTAAG